MLDRRVRMVLDQHATPTRGARLDPGRPRPHLRLAQRRRSAPIRSPAAGSRHGADPRRRLAQPGRHRHRAQLPDGRRRAGQRHRRQQPRRQPADVRVGRARDTAGGQWPTTQQPQPARRPDQAQPGVRAGRRRRQRSGSSTSSGYIDRRRRRRRLPRQRRCPTTPPPAASCRSRRRSARSTPASRRSARRRCAPARPRTGASTTSSTT